MNRRQSKVDAGEIESTIRRFYGPYFCVPPLADVPEHGELHMYRNGNPTIVPDESDYLDRFIFCLSRVRADSVFVCGISFKCEEGNDVFGVPALEEVVRIDLGDFGDPRTTLLARLNEIGVDENPCWIMFDASAEVFGVISDDDAFLYSRSGLMSTSADSGVDGLLSDKSIWTEVDFDDPMLISLAVSDDLSRFTDSRNWDGVRNKRGAMALRLAKKLSPDQEVAKLAGQAKSAVWN